MALYYELSIDDAGFAAFFAAHKHAGYSPQQLGNVREVKLAGGVVGFFRPVGSVGSGAQRISCGTGSGAISDSAGTTPALRETKQQKIITAVADSAILAGPR